MPIEVEFWRINDTKVKKVPFSSIETEQRLEDILFNDLSIIKDDILLLGRQVITTYGKKIDLLAIDEYGKISIIELKKNKTPREVVAQIIDYASWVQELSYKDIIEIYNENNQEPFEKIFEEKFGVQPPEKINQEHDMIIVCSEVDNETERIIDYLSDNYNVPLNVVFFRFFRDNNSEYLTRSWLIDPIEVEEKYSRSKQQNKGESWNGKDFIVNIDVGEDEVSSWEDSVKYSFISAGGGKWYSRSLYQLEPGHRIFAMIPKRGY
ncbi:MAG: endonuclease NucS domain-containing protein [bacterium]